MMFNYRPKTMIKFNNKIIFFAIGYAYIVPLRYRTDQSGSIIWSMYAVNIFIHLSHHFLPQNYQNEIKLKETAYLGLPTRRA